MLLFLVVWQSGQLGREEASTLALPVRFARWPAFASWAIQNVIHLFSA